MTRTKSTEMSARPAIPLQRRMIEAAREQVEQAEAAMRKTCAHALLAALPLMWLHRQSENQGRRNDLTSSHVGQSRKGFRDALAEIGLSKTTAYRWMGAATEALVRAGMVDDGMEVLNNLPDPEEERARWNLWAESLRETAQTTSLRRLTLGAMEPASDDYRADELARLAEDGSEAADLALERVSEGRLTLARALAGVLGAEATRGKARTAPFYLGLDGETGELTGLYPKAVTTLKNTFLAWDEASEPARRRAREAWQALVELLPPDLKR